MKRKVALVVSIFSVLYILTLPFITILVNWILFKITNVRVFGIKCDLDSIGKLIIIYGIYTVITIIIFLILSYILMVYNNTLVIMVGVFGIWILGYFVLKLSFNLVGVEYINNWLLVIWYIFISSSNIQINTSRMRY